MLKSFSFFLCLFAFKSWLAGLVRCNFMLCHQLSAFLHCTANEIYIHDGAAVTNTLNISTFRHKSCTLRIPQVKLENKIPCQGVVHVSRCCFSLINPQYYLQMEILWMQPVEQGNSLASEYFALCLQQRYLNKKS